MRPAGERGRDDQPARRRDRGNPIVILFIPAFTPSVAAALRSFSAELEPFATEGARLFAVTLESAKAVKAQAIPFPVLIDAKGEAFLDFSAHRRDLPTTIVLRPNHHVMAILKDAPETQGAAALAAVRRLAPDRQPELVVSHPPVLLIPDVLSAEDCRRLVEVLGYGLLCRRGKNVTIDVSPDMLRKQLTIVGSWTFSWQGQADCARFVVERKVDVERLFTHRWKLDQAEEAYRVFESQTTGKGVLVM